MSKGDEFRPIVEPGPARYGTNEYQAQAEELVAISAGLTDKEKMIAEYWSDGPATEQPPGHWIRFGEWVSERDNHSIDDDVKMYFALSNAMLDASIATWDAKRTYDSVRPITSIAFLFRAEKGFAHGAAIEPGVTPARPLKLLWTTFSSAADEAGMSRRYGGIHFRAADLAGRKLGNAVALRAWSKAQAYFQGTDGNMPLATAQGTSTSTATLDR